MQVKHRIPVGAVIIARDRKRALALVSSPDLRGGRDVFAEDCWNRLLPGFDRAESRSL